MRAGAAVFGLGFWAFAAGCGGMSLDQPASGAGRGGAGGKGGSGATGGSQAAAGGAGGVGGTGPVGGQPNVGGTVSTGGSGTMGGKPGVGGSTVGGGGSGGMAGVCALPLDSGPCAPAMPRYAFDSTQGRCVGFIYGGCQGNANNFERMEDCIEDCGNADESGCPTSAPVNGSACNGPAHACDYFDEYGGCICQPQNDYFCAAVPGVECPLKAEAPPPDGAAGACSGDDCTAAVIVVSYWTCRCAEGEWSCGFAAPTMGGK